MRRNLRASVLLIAVTLTLLSTPAVAEIVKAEVGVSGMF